MILQSLDQYYGRLKENPQTEIPLYGFGKQKIHFALVINEDGKLVQVRDLREKPKNKPIPLSLTVPQLGKKRSVDIEPNFVWDNTSYVLGRDTKGNEARSLQCFQTFKKFQHDLGKGMKDKGMKGVLRFLDFWKPEDALRLEHWEEMAGANLVFQLDGELMYVHEHPEVQQGWIQYCAEKESTVIATCLVSGETTQSLVFIRLSKAYRGPKRAVPALCRLIWMPFYPMTRSRISMPPLGKEPPLLTPQPLTTFSVLKAVRRSG